VPPRARSSQAEKERTGRGRIRLPVKINPRLSRGVLFVPFHWGDQQRENVAANYVTIVAIGRIAKQPEFKYCAVRLAPAPDAPEPAPAFARPTWRDEPQKAVVV
jgi:sulfite reductase (NADPH) flavoprotein alpha-component